MTVGRGQVTLQRPSMPNAVGSSLDSADSRQFDIFHVKSSTDDVWLHVYFLREKVSSDQIDFLNACSTPCLLNSKGDTIYATQEIDFANFGGVTVGPRTKASLIPVDEWIFMAALRARRMNLARLPFKERRDVIDVFAGGRVHVFPSQGWSVSIEPLETTKTHSDQKS